MPQCRYMAERAEPHVVKHDSPHTRLAAPVLHTYRWRQVAMSEDLDELKEFVLGRKNYRIVDWDTGKEILRTECPAVY